MSNGVKSDELAGQLTSSPFLEITYLSIFDLWSLYFGIRVTFCSSTVWKKVRPWRATFMWDKRCIWRRILQNTVKSKEEKSVRRASRSTITIISFYFLVLFLFLGCTTLYIFNYLIYLAIEYKICCWFSLDIFPTINIPSQVTKLLHYKFPDIIAGKYLKNTFSIAYCL